MYHASPKKLEHFLFPGRDLSHVEVGGGWSGVSCCERSRCASGISKQDGCDGRSLRKEGFPWDDVCVVYLPIHGMVDFYGFHVGIYKHTSPMDPIWGYMVISPSCFSNV